MAENIANEEAVSNAALSHRENTKLYGPEIFSAGAFFLDSAAMMKSHGDFIIAVAAGVSPVLWSLAILGLFQLSPRFRTTSGRRKVYGITIFIFFLSSVMQYVGPSSHYY